MKTKLHLHYPLLQQCKKQQQMSTSNNNKIWFLDQGVLSRKIFATIAIQLFEIGKSNFCSTLNLRIRKVSFVQKDILTDFKSVAIT